MALTRPKPDAAGDRDELIIAQRHLPAAGDRDIYDEPVTMVYPGDRPRADKPARPLSQQRGRPATHSGMPGPGHEVSVVLVLTVAGSWVICSCAPVLDSLM
jgi:hypothetical protein